jgi:hypothetical protein
VFQELSCAFLGFPHACARSRKDHTLQTSQNELAEPYKYSKCIHTSSTVLSGIPRRNWSLGYQMNQFVGTKPSPGSEFRRLPRILACPELLSAAKWSNGLRKRLKWLPDPSLRSGFRQRTPAFATLRLTPARRLNPTPDPSLRSGFRQRTPAFATLRLTPARRLNLLKNFLASTLAALWKKRARLLDQQQAGRVHG